MSLMYVRPLASNGFHRHRPAMTRPLTAVLIREDSGCVALCPEMDVASQGDSVEEARANLREAMELFLECASSAEVEARLSTKFLRVFSAAIYASARE